jgi:hypothetical protein
VRLVVSLRLVYRDVLHPRVGASSHSIPISIIVAYMLQSGSKGITKPEGLRR